MQHLEVQIDGPVASLVIDRPEKHGALNPRLLADLRDGLDEVHREPRIRSVVLRSHGEHFCSGVDMAVLQQIHALPEEEQFQQWFEYWRRLADVCEMLLRFPKPIVAAVDGRAVGAGFALPLACDMIVASERAEFSALAVRHGLVGGVTAALLSFRLGTSLAARMSLTGQPISAAEANRMGLLCQSPVQANEIASSSRHWALESAQGAPQAIQATKRLINESIGEMLLTQIAAAAADSATACTTESAGQGIEAFMNKTKPVW